MATISEALAIAIQHHQAGRLQAAEQIYRQILAVEPNHADAIHLLGVIAHQAGKHEIAVEYIERAIGLQGNAAAFHNNLGEAYRALCRVPEAVACYRRALELKPDYAEAHNNLGIALKDQGKLDEAVACYRRALELKPDYAEAHNNLGNALEGPGKAGRSGCLLPPGTGTEAGLCRGTQQPGRCVEDQGKLDEAVACYRRALELKPRLCRGTQQPGQCVEGPGEAGRSGRLLPPGTGTEAGLCRGARQPGRRFGGDGRFSRARKTPSAPRCGTIPASPWRITNWRNSWAANFRSRIWLRSAGCWRGFCLRRAKGVDGRTTIVAALRPGPSPGRAGRVCRGRRAPRSGQRAATVRVAQARPGVRPKRARVFRHPHDRGLHAGFLRAGPRLWVGKRDPGVRRGAAAIRHDAHRADLGQPLPGLRRGGDQTGRRHHGRARRTRRRLHRGPSPVGPPDGPASRFAALGETSRIESRSASHRGQDAGQLLVSGSVGEPLSAGEVDSLPPRFARRGRLLLDDAFPGSSLGQRPAAHCFTISRVPADDGALAEGLAGAPVGSGLRGDGGRSGRRGPQASWPGAAWHGSRGAWSSTRRSGRSERPAPSRCASRSSGHRWEDGSTTSRPWLRCSPGWKRRCTLWQRFPKHWRLRSSTIKPAGCKRPSRSIGRFCRSSRIMPMRCIFSA